MIEDRTNAGYKKLEEVTNQIVAEANQTPGLSAVFTGFNTKSPAVTADIDRARAEQMGARRSRTSSPRSAPISARPTSTISIFSVGPIG